MVVTKVSHELSDSGPSMFKQAHDEPLCIWKSNPKLFAYFLVLLELRHWHILIPVWLAGTDDD